MKRNFVVLPKSSELKIGKTKVLSIRIDLALQSKYDQLAKESGRSRNELICMALQYALDNLEVPPKEQS